MSAGSGFTIELRDEASVAGLPPRMLALVARSAEGEYRSVVISREDAADLAAVRAHVDSLLAGFDQVREH